MIEGVLRHCTDMTIEKNFVDSHGQSEVAFGFARLLGFELLPRLKAIGKQKLYLPGKGTADAYPNLRPVLTRPVDWTLIRRHYDQVVKYATALRLGTADAESILRRFSRGSSGGAPMHPTYRAVAELGKAIKSAFQNPHGVERCEQQKDGFSASVPVFGLCAHLLWTPTVEVLKCTLRRSSSAATCVRRPCAARSTRA